MFFVRVAIIKLSHNICVINVKKKDGCLMEERENAYGKFQQSIERMNGKYHIIDTDVSMDRQLEYFRYSQDVRSGLSSGTETSVEEQIVNLNSVDSFFMEKRYAMVYLAISGDVTAYRALESYYDRNKENADDYLKMSILQAKMTLESEFTDEKQIFISTGLGGKGDNIRFFAFFKAKDLFPFSSYQKNLIKKEFSFSLYEGKGILEEIDIKDTYFTLLFLINIKSNVQNILESALIECNQYGNFIHTNFIVTNVKKYSESEIRDQLYNKIDS